MKSNSKRKKGRKKERKKDWKKKERTLNKKIPTSQGKEKVKKKKDLFILQHTKN